MRKIKTVVQFHSASLREKAIKEEIIYYFNHDYTKQTFYVRPHFPPLPFSFLKNEQICFLYYYLPFSRITLIWYLNIRITGCLLLAKLFFRRKDLESTSVMVIPFNLYIAMKFIFSDTELFFDYSKYRQYKTQRNIALLEEMRIRSIKANGIFVSDEKDKKYWCKFNKNVLLLTQ